MIAAMLVILLALIAAVVYGTITFAILLNLHILPPPGPDQWVRHLYWRRRTP